MDNKSNGANLGPNQVKITVEAGFLTGPMIIMYDLARGGHNVAAYFPWGNLRFGSNTLAEAFAKACAELLR